MLLLFGIFACSEGLPVHSPELFCISSDILGIYDRKGGSLACIYNENLRMKAPKSQKYESFELLAVKVSIKSKTNTFSLIYRPPSSAKNKIPIRVFLDEFTEHITTLLQQHDDPIILGDINIPWN